MTSMIVDNSNLLPIVLSQNNSKRQKLYSAHLIIITLRENFFARRSEHECMFKLSRIAPLYINKRRIFINNPIINQRFKSNQVLGLAHTIKVSTAERQCAEMFVDCIK